MTILALITIGQAPRTDLTPELIKLLPECTIREYGALDELDSKEIADLAPSDGEGALTSRLRDGGSAVFGHVHSLPLLEKAVSRAEGEGADLSLLLCTGSFLPIHHTRPLYLAERLAHDGVSSLLEPLGSGRLGIVRPLAEQVDEAYDHWHTSIGVRPSTVQAASPYTDSKETIAAAAAAAAVDSDLVVLDCIGFDEAMREAARQTLANTNTSVVTVRSIAARLLGAII